MAVPGAEEGLFPEAAWARFACQLNCCAGALRSALRHAAQREGLNPTDAQVLLALRQSAAASVPQNRLAMLGGLTPAQTSLRLEALRQRDAVESARCHDDRRRLSWRLLPAGEEIATRLLQQVQAALLDELQSSLLRDLTASVNLLLSSDRVRGGDADAASRRGEAA